MRINEETREQIILRSVNGRANIMNENERSKQKPMYGRVV